MGKELAEIALVTGVFKHDEKNRCFIGHFPDTEYLANHPYKARHVAERIPCPKQVMDKIQGNRKREGLPPLTNKKPIKLRV